MFERYEGEGSEFDFPLYSGAAGRALYVPAIRSEKRRDNA